MTGGGEALMGNIFARRRLRRRWAICGGVAGCAWLLGAVLSRSWAALPVTGFWVLYLFVRFVGPVTTVSPRDVYIPWRLHRRRFRWDEIKFVTSDSAADVTVVVLMDDTRVLVSGIRPPRAAEVAAMGHKDYVRPVRTLATHSAPGAGRALDPEKELGRRAAAVAAERDRLDAELARVRKSSS